LGLAFLGSSADAGLRFSTRSFYIDQSAVFKSPLPESHRTQPVRRLLPGKNAFVNEAKLQGRSDNAAGSGPGCPRSTKKPG
jgi:hypothetical protein